MLPVLRLAGVLLKGTRRHGRTRVVTRLAHQRARLTQGVLPSARSSLSPGMVRGAAGLFCVRSDRYAGANASQRSQREMGQACCAPTGVGRHAAGTKP